MKEIPSPALHSYPVQAVRATEVVHSLINLMTVNSAHLSTDTWKAILESSPAYHTSQVRSPEGERAQGLVSVPRKHTFFGILNRDFRVIIQQLCSGFQLGVTTPYSLLFKAHQALNKLK